MQRPTVTALGLLASLLATPGVAAPLDGVTSVTLDNGLTVVTIEDHRAPVLVQMVWYRVGSADDPAGHSGVAHFLEHLMFKATETRAEGEFSRIVAENGGEDNAFTTADATAYFERLAADRLELTIGMEADRMVHLAPTEAGVLAERDVVLEERKMVIDSAPTAALSEEVAAALYLNHPYGRPVIGWEHEIAALTRTRAMDFYRTHYAPDNAVLIAAGDVDPEEVRQLAERYFGPIPAASVAPRERPQEPPHRAARRVAMEDPRVTDPLLSRSYLAPVRQSGAQEEAAALTILAEVLGGDGVTSVLARTLVLGDGPAIAAEVSYNGASLDPQSFDVYAVPKSGVELDKVEAALDAALADFVAAGPDPRSIARVKRRLEAAEIYRQDDLGSRATQIGMALTSGLTLDDVAAWPEVLAAVTAEDVQAAARKVLQRESSVTGRLTPPAAGEASTAAAVAP